MCRVSVLLSDDAWDNRFHLFILRTMAADARSALLSSQIPVADRELYRFTRKCLSITVIFPCNLCRQLSRRRSWRWLDAGRLQSRKRKWDCDYSLRKFSEIKNITRFSLLPLSGDKTIVKSEDEMLFNPRLFLLRVFISQTRFILYLDLLRNLISPPPRDVRSGGDIESRRLSHRARSNYRAL